MSLELVIKNSKNVEKVNEILEKEALKVSNSIFSITESKQVSTSTDFLGKIGVVSNDV